jgi:hypothetical protein
MVVLGGGAVSYERGTPVEPGLNGFVGSNLCGAAGGNRVKGLGFRVQGVG